jgi:hypothetical protein
MTVRSFSLLIAFTALAATLGGCSAPPPTADEQKQQVRQAFDGFKDSLALAHAHEALSYIDRPSRDYLQQIATKAPDPADTELVILIRRAVAKLTPGGIQPGFTIETPLQAVLNAGWVTPADLGELTLGPVTLGADGTHAQAEALWLGTPSTFQVQFVRESDSWKIDLFNVLPIAQSALGMDRAVKNQTEAQQLDRLVGEVPNP